MRYYAAYIVSYFPSFRDRLSATSSRGLTLEHTNRNARPLKMGPKGCSETLITHYKSTLRNIPEERTPDLPRGGS
jgi:hypothetical protein